MFLMVDKPEREDKIMKGIPSNYRSITYKAFWDEGKITKDNFEQFKELCNKHNAIVDDWKTKNKYIWFGGLGDKTKDFFEDIDKFVGIK